MTHSFPPRQATDAEIIHLAAQEGHDADIPTNLGSIHPTPSNPSTRPHSPFNEEDIKTVALEKDIEKGISPGSESTDTEDTEADLNIVDFDGPDDPQNPLNWGFTKKWGTVLLVSAITFLTPLASSNFAPGVPDVMRDFGSTNDMLQGFMVSVYVLGFSFGPLRTLISRARIESMLTFQLSPPYRKCMGGFHCTIAAICCSSSLLSLLRSLRTWKCS